MRALKMNWNFVKKRRLAVIFMAAGVVGVAHYGLTGMKDLVASCYIALYAGWGALAFDVFYTLQNWKPNSSARSDPQESAMNGESAGR